MRLKTFILAAIATIALATPAWAALTVNVSSQNDLAALTAGDQFTLDIELTTTTAGEARGLTLRAAGWNAGDLSFVSATVPNFGGPATPTGAVFGLDLGGGIIINALTSTLATEGQDNGTDVLLFNGVTTGATTSAGPETFTATFTALSEGTVGLNIGAIASFGDAYVATSGTTAPFTPVTVTVPEPGAVAASLAALGSVFGVVTIRRRQDG